MKKKTKKTNSNLKFSTSGLKLTAISVSDAFPYSKWAENPCFRGYLAVVPVQGDVNDKRYRALRRDNLRRIVELAHAEHLVNWRKVSIPAFVRIHWRERLTTLTRTGSGIKDLRVAWGESQSTVIKLQTLIDLGLRKAIDQVRCKAII